MGLIYKVTNLKNKMIYIGLTSRTLDQRKKEHYYKAFSDSKNKKSDFHKALKSFNKSDFKWEIIENNIPIKDLPNKERYWIKYYNSYKKGYNMNSGGANEDGFRNWRKTILKKRFLYTQKLDIK